MATDKFPQAVEGESILTADNNDRAKLTIGNVIPRMSETEILANVTADTDIIVFNTTTNMFECWHGTTDRRIIG